jgi:flagellar biogenesis protein FliO
MVGTRTETVTQAAGRETAIGKLLWSALQEWFGKVRIQKKERALRIQETLPLGERRFLAVVRWEEQTLLVGVTPQTITLLERRDTEQRRATVAQPEHRR